MDFTNWSVSWLIGVCIYLFPWHLSSLTLCSEILTDGHTCVPHEVKKERLREVGRGLLSWLQHCFGEAGDCMRCSCGRERRGKGRENMVKAEGEIREAEEGRVRTLATDMQENSSSFWVFDALKLDFVTVLGWYLTSDTFDIIYFKMRSVFLFKVCIQYIYNQQLVFISFWAL